MKSEPVNYTQISENIEINGCRSGVFWSAIFGGALASAAVSIILLSIGAGIGFAAVSPWSRMEETAAAFTIATAIWLVITQWVSAGFGGYVTGRLRTRWHNMHTHEGFFRDTAHGFLTWALSTVLVIVFSIAAAPHHRAMTHDGQAFSPMAYDVDRLYRGKSEPVSEDLRAETGRILARDAVMPEGADDDRRYLTQLVTSHTGLSNSEAQARIDNVISDEKVKMDRMRKAASALAFYTAFSMLVGAFIAAVAAALGGHDRDAHDRLPRR